MSKNATKERIARAKEPQQVPGGFSATTSAWYFMLVGEIYRQSRTGNRDIRWPLAGIPMLLTGTEAFVLEHQHRLRTPTESKLAVIDPLLEVLKPYGLPAELLQKIDDLIDIRNEIVHPISFPTRNPEYIERLQQRGLLV